MISNTCEKNALKNVPDAAAPAILSERAFREELLISKKRIFLIISVTCVSFSARRFFLPLYFSY